METVILKSRLTQAMSEVSAITDQVQASSAPVLAAEHSSAITAAVSLESRIDLEER